MDELPAQPAVAPQRALQAQEAASRRSSPDLQTLLTLIGRGGPNTLPAKSPDPELVMETLDAEMARIEQTIVRSGWTSWIGTAALAGIAWIFVDLFDAHTPLPWSRFAVLTTFLSFIQDFVYSLDNALRPRRVFGLPVGDQMRMVVSAETLPYARPQYLFDGLRATLLMAASWYFLSEYIGWIWLLSFIWYSGTFVTMCVLFALSLRQRLVPKRIKFFPGELVRHTILAGLGCFGLHALASTWEATDFLALKAALLAIAAMHVLRGLMAPRFELPMLESLREIRRKLGFGQMASHEAVFQAEVALFGYNAILALTQPLQVLGTSMKQLYGEVRRVSEDLDVLTRQIAVLSGHESIRMDDLALREVLARDILGRMHTAMDTAVKAAAAHDRLVQRIEHYHQRTVNDGSLPLVIEVANRQALARSSLTDRLVAAVGVLLEQLDTLAAIAPRQQSGLTLEVREAARAFQQKLGPSAAGKPAST